LANYLANQPPRLAQIRQDQQITVTPRKMGVIHPR
jgi:hypothetical protein